MATQDTGGGSTTSFTNTPQAKDDTYTYLEDLLRANSTLYNVATNTIYLDVMSNDLGGGAKALFSVSDGDGNPITSDYELLCKDVNAAGCSPWEATLNGNWVRINNGKIEYRIADGSGIPGQGRSVDTLAGGEAFSDQFVYAIRLGNGTLSQANVTINITGANDGTVIVPGGTLNGGVVEDSGTYNASGSFGFTDVDATDTHTVSVTPGAAGYLGTLTPTVSNDSTGDGSGTVSWSFAVANADLQFLGEGETRTQTYTVTVDDGHGGTASQTVTIVLTGDNDPVVMTGGDVAGAVGEDSGTYSDSGSFGFADVDLIDTHAVSVVPDAAGYLGTLTATKTDDSTGDGAGTVGWSFTVANADLQFLGEGETRNQTYTVTVNDGQGGAQTQTVTVVLTGDNDPVVIVAGGDVSGAVTEDGGSYSDSGSFDFTDIDLSDSHTVSVVPDDTGYLGTLTPSVSDVSTGDGAGTVGWSFTVANGDLQFLGEGETRTQTYTVSVNDGKGSIATQTVTVVLTGDNDPVVITGGDVSGAVEEDSGTYSDSGSFGFTDVDLSDVHSVSVVPDAAGYLGTLTATKTDDSTGDGAGTVGWSFIVANGDLQFLGEGETRTQTYTVSVNDGKGSIATQTVTVVLTGDNDPVVIIAGGDVGGAVTEDGGAYSDTGSFGFTDVDLSDVHAVSVTPDALGYLGTLTATKTDDSTGDGTGTVGWSFTVANGDLQFLGEGETRTQTYTVSVNDGKGSIATQTVTVVLTGDNDPIVITSAAQSDSLSEDGTSVSGTITFSDVDLSDTHSASAAANAANTTALGTFSIDPSVTEAANAANGSLGWSYTVDNAAANYLAVDESVVETYDVTFSDGHGGTVTETVTVTITGANDGPDIRVADGDSAAADRDETNAGLTASGTLTVTDPDTSDTVDTTATVSVSGNQGPLSDGDLLAMFDITTGASSLPANIGDSNNLSWAFDSGSEAFDFLADGDLLTLTYTLTSDDGHGGTDTQDVTIIITGTNDIPVLTASLTGHTYVDTANDDAFSNVSGLLTTVDPDTGDTATYSVSGGVPDPGLLGYDTSSTNAYGKLYLNSTSGAYVFVPNDGAIEALKTDTSVAFTLTVTDSEEASDSETLTISLDGANDTPELGTVTDASYTDTSGDDVFGNVTGTLTSSDRDSPETATYGVAGGVASVEPGFNLQVPGAYGTFYLNSLTGDYKFVPDDGAIEGLKATTSVDFNVTVTDGSGASDGDTLTITLNGLNDTPEAPATNSVTTDEDTASSAVAIGASDRDSGEVLTYSVKPGFGPSIGSVGFDQVAGTFTYTPAPNANGPDSFTILVTDASGATTEQVVSVTVNAVNDAPVITSGDGDTAAVNVAENSTAVTTVTATDIDSPTVTFSIAGGADAALFAIDGTTGVLSFLAAPDFENPQDAGGNNVYNVIVQASDGALTDTQAIAVTVTNVNEAPAITSDGAGATASVDVAENSTAVTTVTAVDPDASTTLVFSIVGGADAALFAIDSATGVLTFVAGPDYENPADAGADNVYDVTVRASDGSLSDDQAISVTVTNQNDNAPVITSDGGGDSASVSVAENTTAVADVDATDADGDTLTYSISGGADALKFAIDPDTGVLTFIAAPDFENPTDAGADNVYDVEVTASDGTHVDTQSLAVTVTNQNDNAPVITSDGGGDSASVSVAENTTAVADVDATDADGDTLTYSISGGADALKFAIDPDTGVLTFIAAPDFENPTDAGGDNVYDVEVQASDGTHVDTQTLAVTVTNQNDNAPVITSNGGNATAAVSVAENSTAVTTVTATDADGNPVTFSITGGADALKFAIDPNSGVLTFVAAPDFEAPTDAGANNVYDVVVTASDGTHVDTQSIAVTVTNVNEAPAITSDGGGASASVNVAENGTAVTTVVATDPDAATTITYSIVGGADAALFSIDPNSGALSFVSAPDFESPTDAGGNNVYDVVVQASDGALADTQSIAVTVTDVNAAPVITSNGGNASASVNVAENTTAVTTVVATDDGENSNTLTYSIVGGADAAKFAIDPNTGALSFISAPNFEAPSDVAGGTSVSGNNVYDVVVRASDGSLSDDQAIAVTVTDVNEAPVVANIKFVPNASAFDSGNVSGVIGTFVAYDAAGNVIPGVTFTASSVVGSGLSLAPNGTLTATSNLSDTTITFNVVASGGYTEHVYFQVGKNNADDMLPTGAPAGTDLLIVFGLNGNDGLTGGGNDDVLYGGGNGAQTDTINGGTADDYLIGGAGNDTLTGSSGADILRGGQDDDTLDGQGDPGQLDLIDLSDATGALVGASAFTLGVGGNGSYNGGAVGLGLDTYSNMEGVIGGTGNDSLTGNASDNEIRGGGGNDTITGLGGNDILKGDAGNDIMSGGTGNDTFVLGPTGVDTITDYSNVAGNADIIDVSAYLSVDAGTDVIGGQYLRVTTTGLVQVDADGGGTWVTVANVNMGPASYSVRYYDGGVLTTVSVTPSGPPVALDMDGDGQVSFLAANAGATFDYGYGKVATAWVAGNDGLLVRDANHDGQVSASELVFATSGSDLEGLRVYDSNGDGQLSAADSGFADFAVWQDADSDGAVDSGEMVGLTALGIASISLTSDGVGYSAAGGDVQVVGTGSYTRTDGSIGILADAVFATGSAADQRQVLSAAGSNAALIGAIAAAGLAAGAPAATAGGEGDSATRTFDAPLTGSGLELGPVAATAVAKLQAAEQMAASGDPAEAPLAGDARAVADAAQFAGQLDSGSQHAAPAELPQGGEAPSHAALFATTALTAPSVAMPSAAKLGALAPAEPDGAQHNQVVGQVLAEALSGGGQAAPDIDALLNGLAGHAGGIGASLAAGQGDAMAIAAGVLHDAALAHAGITIGVLHPDVAPPA